jgi:hypothetical protein
VDDSGAVVYGAEVEIVTQGHKQLRRVDPTRSYLSQVETTLSFGLGTIAEIEKVIITWPDGVSRSIINPKVNQRHTVTPTTRDN